MILAGEVGPGATCDETNLTLSVPANRHHGGCLFAKQVADALHWSVTGNVTLMRAATEELQTLGT